MSTLTATRIKKLTDFNGDAALYRLNDTDQFVAVSSIEFRGNPETLVFSTDELGEVADWGELAGGRGVLTHEAALKEMGYEVIA